MAAGFFDSVALSNHNHSTTPGDGGQLSSPVIAGVPTATGSPGATSADLATTGWAAVWAAIMGA